MNREKILKVYNAAMSTDSWFDLEKRIKDKKDPLLPKRILHDKELITISIAAAHTLVTGKTRNNEYCPIDFPGTSLTKENITYHVHGISHDMQHRRVIKNTFGILENAVFESDLSVMYSTRGVDHPRHNEIKYLSSLDLLSMLLSPRIILIQIIDHLLFFRRQKAKSKIGDYRRIGRIRLEEETEDLGQSKGEEDTERRYGQNYLDLEISDALLPGHLADNWTSYHLEDRFHRACLLRSLALTEYIEKVAKRMGAGNMHGIMGFGHERQVAYFLENPDVAEFLAQIYQPSWPIRMARKLRSPSAALALTACPIAEEIIHRAEQTIHSIDAQTFSYLTASDGIILGWGALLAGTLYRKHKHRFTNRMYLRSLLSPKQD